MTYRLRKQRTTVIDWPRVGGVIAIIPLLVCLSCMGLVLSSRPTSPPVARSLPSLTYTATPLPRMATATPQVVTEKPPVITQVVILVPITATPFPILPTIPVQARPAQAPAQAPVVKSSSQSQRRDFSPGWGVTPVPSGGSPDGDRTGMYYCNEGKIWIGEMEVVLGWVDLEGGTIRDRNAPAFLGGHVAKVYTGCAWRHR